MKGLISFIIIVLVLAAFFKILPFVAIACGIVIVIAVIVKIANRPKKHKAPTNAKIADTKVVYNRGSPEGYIIDRSYYTKVAGVTFNGTQRILPNLKSGMALDFVREPHNIHDKNAVAIFCSGYKIGHLSRDEAAEIAPIMDNGIPVDGVIEEITGGGNYNYGCNIRVKIYKHKTERKREPKRELQPTVENIDKSNPIYGKTCVFFDYSYPDEEQNIVNLGGILRRSVSGKTDYYIVKNFNNFYNTSTVETNKVLELMQNGGKIQFLSDEEYSKIKERYLPQ